MQFWVTIGLLTTQQVERMAEEGHDFFRVDALDALGRRDDAFELAFDLARKRSKNSHVSAEVEPRIAALPNPPTCISHGNPNDSYISTARRHAVNPPKFTSILPISVAF